MMFDMTLMSALMVQFLALKKANKRKISDQSSSATRPARARKSLKASSDGFVTNVFPGGNRNPISHCLGVTEMQ